jgi:hypothetical protein
MSAAAPEFVPASQRAHPPTQPIDREQDIKLQFILRLKDSEELSGAMSAELIAALRSRHLLVSTAFEIGERTQDAAHLVSLLQDLSTRLLGGDDVVLSAMMQMVACARDVAIRANFSAASYVQLANTILVCPEATSAAFEIYKENKDPASALNHLLHFAYGDDEEEEKGENQSDESEDEEDGGDDDEEAQDASDHESQTSESEEEEVVEDPEYAEYNEVENRRSSVALEVESEDGEEYEEDFEDDTSVDRDKRESEEPSSELGSDLAAIIERLRSTLATLKKHEQYVEAAIVQCVEDAKSRIVVDDREGAMECLRKKALYEEKLGEIKESVKQLASQLDEAEVTGRALKTMYAREQEEHNKSSETQEAQAKSEEDGEKDDQAQSHPKLADVSQGVALMVRAGLIENDDAMLLFELIEEQHFIVKACWEYYLVDPSIEELADTLMQLVKLEKQRRAQSADTPSEEATTAEEPAPPTPAPSPVPSAPPAETPAAEDILESVPPLFAKILVSALDMDVLSKQQVVYFVNAYNEGDELVRAAWALFELQQNVKDLIDTLYRIYQLHLQPDDQPEEEEDEEEQEQQEEEEEQPSPTTDTSSSQTTAEEEEDVGMKQLMAILNQCMELLSKREEIRSRQGSDRPALTPTALEAVRELGRKKDPLLIAVLADFSERRDVDQLLDHLYVIALESQTTSNVDGSEAEIEEDAEGEEEDNDVEDVEDVPEESMSSQEAARNLQVSDHQQKIMIIDAMFSETIINDLEKQALEVLILKKDNTLEEAFSKFFSAVGQGEQLERLEQLSLSLRSIAEGELNRLRSAISQGEEPFEQGETGGGDTTTVQIYEDEESYEEDEEEDAETDPLSAMNKALSSTLEHLGLPQETKEALLACGDDERVVIIAAIDVFQMTKDVDDLKDTLMRIARQFMENKRLEAMESRLRTAERQDATQGAKLAGLEAGRPR